MTRSLGKRTAFFRPLGPRTNGPGCRGEKPTSRWHISPQRQTFSKSRSNLKIDHKVLWKIICFIFLYTLRNIIGLDALVAALSEPKTTGFNSSWKKSLRKGFFLRRSKRRPGNKGGLVVPSHLIGFGQDLQRKRRFREPAVTRSISV